MLILKAIGKFLWNNWLTVLIVLACIFLYFKFTGALSDYKDMVAQRDTSIAELRARNVAAEVKAASALATIDKMEEDRVRIEILHNDALRRQDDSRDLARRQMEIFEKHNLQRLVDAKPGLIQPRANKASQEKMDAIEKAFNQ